jgi:four helix bundle protein
VGVPIKTFRELRCWQLAHELRCEVIAICAREPASRQLRFCDSFQDTAGSVCRNLAEGFARYESGEIVQFFRYALGSLAELQEHLEDCKARGLVDKHHFERLQDLSEHTKAATLKFMKPHVARRHSRKKSQARRT